MIFLREWTIHATYPACTCVAAPDILRLCIVYAVLHFYDIIFIIAESRVVATVSMQRNFPHPRPRLRREPPASFVLFYRLERFPNPNLEAAVTQCGLSINR